MFTGDLMGKRRVPTGLMPSLKNYPIKKVCQDDGIKNLFGLSGLSGLSGF
jgi:hypothetical protein